jgi:hypothetical protein
VGNRNDLRMLATPELRQDQACSAASLTFIPGVGLSVCNYWEQ